MPFTALCLHCAGFFRRWCEANGSFELMESSWWSSRASGSCVFATFQQRGPVCNLYHGTV